MIVLHIKQDINSIVTPTSSSYNIKMLYTLVNNNNLMYIVTQGVIVWIEMTVILDTLSIFD